MKKAEKIDQITLLKDQGKTAKEISQITGYSESYINNLAAELGIKKQTPITAALEKMKKAPNTPVEELKSTLKLTESEIKNLYKHQVWKTEILPQRILQTMKTDLKWSCRELDKTNKHTKQVLYSQPDFLLWLRVRQEYDTYLQGLAQIRQKHFLIHTVDGEYDLTNRLHNLTEYRKSIPDELRYTSSKKRPLPVGHDAEYTNTVHNIYIIESRIYTGRMKEIEKYTKEFCETALEQTKELIAQIYSSKHINAAAPVAGTEEENRLRWVSIDEFFKKLNPDEGSEDLNGCHVSPVTSKRFGKAGSNRIQRERNNAISAIT